MEHKQIILTLKRLSLLPDELGYGPSRQGSGMDVSNHEPMERGWSHSCYVIFRTELQTNVQY
jgi:hypothetical protein